MTDIKKQEKINYLKHLRHRFRTRVGEVKQHVLERRRENREFRDFWRDFLRDRGVPAEFRVAKLGDVQHLDNAVALETFQSIIKHVESPEDRRLFVRHLDNIATGQTGTEKVEDAQQRLRFDIFKNVTGECYTFPKPSNYITQEDIMKSNFWNLIYRGISAYKQANVETRIEFNKAVMPRVKKAKFVVPQILQQQSR